MAAASTSLLVLWLAFSHVGGKYSPPCRNGAPSTLSASLWSGLRYQISLIEERPFLFDFGVNVFPSSCISMFFFLFLSLPRFLGFPRMDFREWISAVGVFFFLFLVFVFPTRCVRVSSSVGDGLGGFRLPLTYGCSMLFSIVGLVVFKLPEHFIL